MVQIMLENLYMTTFTLRLIGTAINLALNFVPRNYKQKDKGITNAGHVHIGIKGGWQYKEFRSSESGFTHRYYYHPGPDKNAPVFLFLHGLAFDGRNFLNVSSLAEKWQLIAYNFPETSKVYRGDMNDFKYLIDDFLDSLGIDSLYLCGVSFGGGIATRFAASHVRRVRALVLVSTFIMNSSRFDRIKSREMARIILKNPDYKLRWLIDYAYGHSLNGKNNPMRELSSIIKVKELDWYRQVVRAITTCEGPEDAVQIKCPVMALHGSKDKTIPLKSARSIPKYIPHASFEVIENGTHAMMYLQGEDMAARIMNFCKGLL